MIMEQRFSIKAGKNKQLMLVKHPMVVGENVVLVGVRDETLWEDALGIIS